MPMNGMRVDGGDGGDPPISPLQGFLAGGLIGLARALDTAYEREEVEDPEALRRAEEAVRLGMPIPGTGALAEDGEADPSEMLPAGLPPNDAPSSAAPPEARVPVRRSPQGMSDNEYLERMASGTSVSAAGLVRVLAIMAFLLAAVIFLLSR